MFLDFRGQGPSRPVEEERGRAGFNPCSFHRGKQSTGQGQRIMSLSLPNALKYPRRIGFQVESLDLRKQGTMIPEYYLRSQALKSDLESNSKHRAFSPPKIWPPVLFVDSSQCPTDTFVYVAVSHAFNPRFIVHDPSFLPTDKRDRHEDLKLGEVILIS